MKRNIRRTWIAVTLLAFLGVTALLVAPAVKLSAFGEYAGGISGSPEAGATPSGYLMEVSQDEVAVTLVTCKNKAGATQCTNQGAGCTAAGGGGGLCDDSSDTAVCFCDAV
jgi:hypothetical protein